MINTDTLFCEIGQHEWEREKKRGRKPTSCPDHKPAVRSTMPAEEAARRRQEGRSRANAERAQAGIQRVVAWSEWVTLDREITVQRALASSISAPLPRRAPMPVIPSTGDYAAAKDAGVYQGVAEEAA